MTRYKITIEYLGTNLCGWQRQKDGISAQGLLEDAINKFSNERVTVFGAGRTDAGVHATGQVAHFELTKNYPEFTVTRAINHFLKPYLIAVQACAIVDSDFHARFSATMRHYTYRIINREGKTAIDIDRVWHVREPLSIEAMKEASTYLIGTHDFTSFRTIHCQAKSPIKTIEKISLEKAGGEIKIHFSAPSFLHHMVRNIVGTLVYVGLNKITAQDVQKILDAKNRSCAPPTSPACGLYFTKVDY
jgi:tRNA pseudouridine38-40 synthase